MEPFLRLVVLYRQGAEPDPDGLATSEFPGHPSESGC